MRSITVHFKRLI